MKLSLIFTLSIAAAAAMPSSDQAAANQIQDKLKTLSQSIDPQGHVELTVNGLVQSLDYDGNILAETQLDFNTAHYLRTKRANDARSKSRSSAAKLGRSAADEICQPYVHVCETNLDCQLNWQCNQCVNRGNGNRLCI